ncbi:MAG: hypothetical protein L3K14_00675 [Thermoplasmata archaeon]|nr:hypothetical protein [Thermoplasmata archaeon]
MRIKGLHLVLAIAAILGAASGASALAVSASHGTTVTASTCGGTSPNAPHTHIATMDGSGDDNETGTNDSHDGDNGTGDNGTGDNETGDQNDTGDNETGDQNDTGDNETGDQNDTGGNETGGQNETGANDTGSPDSGVRCGSGPSSPDTKGRLTTGRVG